MRACAAPSPPQRRRELRGVGDPDGGGDAAHAPAPEGGSGRGQRRSAPRPPRRTGVGGEGRGALWGNALRWLRRRWASRACPAGGSGAGAPRSAERSGVSVGSRLARSRLWARRGRAAGGARPLPRRSLRAVSRGWRLGAARQDAAGTSRAEAGEEDAGPARVRGGSLLRTARGGPGASAETRRFSCAAALRKRLARVLVLVCRDADETQPRQQSG